MRRGCLLAIVVFTALSLSGNQAPGAGAAAPEGEPKAAATTNGHGTPHAAESKDIFGKSLDLAIWTIVVFLVLLFVLRKFAWKPMLEGLQKREENIHAAVEEAQKAREEAQQLRVQLQKEMDAAQDKVRAMMDEARRDAQHTSDEMLSKAKSEIQAERDRQRDEIKMARDQALQQLWSQSAQLATLIASKAVRRQLSIDDQRRLVDEAVAELRQAGDERRREVASVQA